MIITDLENNKSLQMNEPKIQAVIFDIDGTLADSVPLIIAAFRKAVEPLVKRSLSDEEIMESFGPDEEGSVKKIAPNDYKKGTKDFLDNYEAMHDMCSLPFNGITDLLQMLKDKGVHLAIATGKSKYTSDFSLKCFKLTSYFEQIQHGSPDGSRKVEAIHEILQSFGDVEAEAVVYAGDSKADIKESKEAGVKAVAAAWASTVKKEELKAENPDAFFETVDAFCDWLKKRI